MARRDKKANKKELFVIDSRAHGVGPVIFSWHPDGTYIASSGQNKILHIHDRTGARTDEVALTFGVCIGMDWDSEGELLAVIQTNSPAVLLWDKNSRKSTVVDMGTKDIITWAKWSKSGPPILAVGTMRGVLILYNKRSHRKTPIMGTYQRKIICGAWNSDNVLALCDEARHLTISNSEGEVLDQAEVPKVEPYDLMFGEMKMDSRAHQENTISMDLGHKTIYLYNIEDKENHIELAFQPKYGSITCYRWFGDGYMMLGFSAGYYVVISTHIKEIGQELFSNKFFTGEVGDAVFSPTIQKAAVCGDSSVRICDIGNWKNVTATFSLDDEAGRASKLQWTTDGQILSASTVNGFIYSFLTRLLAIHACFETRWAQLVSLQQVSITDFVKPSNTIVVDVAIEPVFIALGPNHLAAGMNNHIWYYQIGTTPAISVGNRDYLGTVSAVALNATHVAVLAEGRVHLHSIGGEGLADEGEGSKLFPEKDDGDVKIKCITLAGDFFIYGTSDGSLFYFCVSAWTNVNEYRHNNGIVHVSSNAQGTRLAFIDTTHSAFIYNPVNDQLVPITPFSSHISSIMWDNADWGVFVAVEPEVLHTYTFFPTTVSGPAVMHIGTTPYPSRSAVVLVHNGQVTLQDETGSVRSINLLSHQDVAPPIALTTVEKQKAAFSPTMKLNRIKDALDLAVKIKDKPYWINLANEAMRQLDVELATACFRQAGDANMVLGLQKVQSIEEKNLLAGHMCLLLGEYTEAQKLFLSSSRPISALEMRRDLLQWEQALTLAKTLAPNQIPLISREYAQQLEFKGDYSAALEQYQRASSVGDEVASTGVARCTIRLGDIAKGMILLQSTKDPGFLCECAIILESVKQYMEAASLYERAGILDKAASIYIRTKNYNMAAPLMAKITIPKIHAEYARAKEEQGNYVEAERSYVLAKDSDSVIRINLEHLKNPEKAFELVRQTCSPVGARLAAKFCQANRDFISAIEFMLLANLPEEAFALAQAHEEMDTFAAILGDKGSTEQYVNIAHYYEARGEFIQAGTFYAQSGQYSKALKLFIQAGEPAIDKAIDVIGKTKNEGLIHQLLDYLMGDTDGVPKDPNYIFKLYMALGNYAQAAKTAVIIARSEQELGNYKVAHSILFDTYRSLEEHSIKILFELKRALLVVHSYVLAKLLVKSKRHNKAARVLIRVARNISKFPAHVVPILTLTVIECHRAGLKKSLFEFAAVLMRPENRSKIDAQYKRKIESIVRKPDKVEAEEKCTPCPVCRISLPRSELDCASCKSALPYCIATGLHMETDKWACCPLCKFPAIYKSFVKLVSVEKCCPMCDQPLDPSQIKREENPFQLLKRSIESVENETGDDSQ